MEFRATSVACVLPIACKSDGKDLLLSLSEKRALPIM
jgi:hypothetical protein